MAQLLGLAAFAKILNEQSRRRMVKEFIGYLAHECFGQAASINHPMGR
jgi:hypothetical protein